MTHLTTPNPADTLLCTLLDDAHAVATAADPPTRLRALALCVLPPDDSSTVTLADPVAGAFDASALLTAADTPA